MVFKVTICWISDFHSGDYEENFLLGGRMLLAGYLLCLLFDPEDGNSIYPQNQTTHSGLLGFWALSTDQIF
jgi:hypothetical protein